MSTSNFLADVDKPNPCVWVGGGVQGDAADPNNYDTKRVPGFMGELVVPPGSHVPAADMSAILLSKITVMPGSHVGQLVSTA